MEVRVAKEYLHLRDWLTKAERIVDRGSAEYEQDELLQEAGDALMMKIGKAANRLDRLGTADPDGVASKTVVANRNWLIHQYDHIDRDVTWATLAVSLPQLRDGIDSRIAEAAQTLCLWSSRRN